jgi:hypothetical protein
MSTTPEWLTVDREFVGTREETVAAFAGLLRYSLEHRLAEKYPTPKIVRDAIIARESHYRACPTCSVGGIGGNCPDGRRYADAVDLACEQSRQGAAR